MKICVLSSGSKGNVSYLEAEGKKFLLDAGRNYKYIENALKDIGVDIKDLNYILITHDHSDHITALKTLVTKTQATVITSAKIFSLLESIKDYPNTLVLEDEVTLENNIIVTSIHSSHDAIDSRNYIIEAEGKKVAYITDTGYINNKYFKVLANLDVYLFESNHDIELLQHGPYPAWLKKRILSDEGHLSNKLSSFYLSKLVGDKTKKIILIHLSENNNLEEIALETINNTFLERGIKFSNIECARQEEKTEVVEV